MKLHLFTETGIMQDPPVPITTLDGALVWTELRLDSATQLDELRKGCDTLIINTKTERRTYLNPKLVGMSSNGLVLSALTDRDPSGTLAGPEKIFIVVEL